MSYNKSKSTTKNKTNDKRKSIKAAARVSDPSRNLSRILDLGAKINSPDYSMKSLMADILIGEQAMQYATIPWMDPSVLQDDASLTYPSSENDIKRDRQLSSRQAASYDAQLSGIDPRGQYTTLPSSMAKSSFYDAGVPIPYVAGGGLDHSHGRMIPKSYPPTQQSGGTVKSKSTPFKVNVPDAYAQKT
jgi:hypothetical protein